jgi:2'-5' RNA ligase
MPAARPESHAVGISLWLVPEEPAREKLAALIDRLSARWKTPSFPPHVTLLAGLEGREGDVVRRTSEMCRALEPLRLRASRAEATPAFFRCVALRVEETLALLTARAQAAITFSRTDEAAFEPHLSLAYGRLEESARDGVIDELKRDLPLAFGATRLEAWRTVGPVEDWRLLAGFDFGVPALEP